MHVLCCPFHLAAGAGSRAGTWAADARVPAALSVAGRITVHQSCSGPACSGLPKPKRGGQPRQMRRQQQQAQRRPPTFRHLTAKSQTTAGPSAPRKLGLSGHRGGRAVRASGAAPGHSLGLPGNASSPPHAVFIRSVAARCGEQARRSALGARPTSLPGCWSGRACSNPPANSQFTQV